MLFFLKRNAPYTSAAKFFALAILSFNISLHATRWELEDLKNPKKLELLKLHSLLLKTMLLPSIAEDKDPRLNSASLSLVIISQVPPESSDEEIKKYADVFLQNNRQIIQENYLKTLEANCLSDIVILTKSRISSLSKHLQLLWNLNLAPHHQDVREKRKIFQKIINDLIEKDSPTALKGNPYEKQAPTLSCFIHPLLRIQNAEELQILAGKVADTFNERGTDQQKNAVPAFQERAADLLRTIKDNNAFVQNKRLKLETEDAAAVGILLSLKHGS